MKVISYTALHYGTDYLYWAIRSVIDHVDEHHILYSAVGSHGHRTDRPCPDTRHALYREAVRAAGDKLRWHDGEWAHEGLQRESILQHAPDADVILVVDADEIWPPGDHPMGQLSQILAASNAVNVHNVRLKMIHYWRSFYRAVLRDPAYPVRIIYPARTGDATISIWPINHMGYAQRSGLVEYKQHVHGHKGEWRKDDWFNTVFMANAQTNCHPVGSEYWNPEPVKPLDYMPEWMKDHPYFNMEVIP